jgi:4-hydroxymandelate synthase
LCTAQTDDHIVSSICALRDRGAELLNTPDSYYDVLAERIESTRHSVGELWRLDILLDEDHDGQSSQIFARSTHPRRTFFFAAVELAAATVSQ